MKILVTGGSGKLGTELKKHLVADYPTEDELNVLDIKAIGEYDLIVHMAAYVDVDQSEVEPFKCFDVNVQGTYNMLKAFAGKPFVFVSTEHVYAPGVHWRSKLIGELMVQNLAKNFLIVRTLFKPNPWPWEFAFVDQMTQGDYVDVIAKLLAKEIMEWDQKSRLISYVGTGRKSMFDLAKRTKPDVKGNSVRDLKFKRPIDYR